jgi:hypothetical protein
MRAFLTVAALPLLLVACTGGNNGATPATGPSPAPQPVTILTTELPRAEVGAPYSHQLDGSGADDWQMSGASAPLPAGMSLHPTGLITGTPAGFGLHELEIVASNSSGGAATKRLDLVVYENLFYSYAPDPLDTPANDDAASATPLGTLSMATPLVQPGPLSVTSNPAAPDEDWFHFSTPTRGTITVEVFFNNAVGKVITGLHGEHNGVMELKAPGIPGTGANDNLITLHDAAAGDWYLKVEAQYKNFTWYANAYAFRIRFNELTIADELIELDLSALQPAQLQAFHGGLPAAGGSWSVVSGSMPAGLSLGGDGLISGTPTQPGLLRVTAAVQVNGLEAQREIAIRVYDSIAGDYWKRQGERRLYDPGRVNGDGVHHELYCEAMVVAPHPAYGPEGAIYVIGGRETDTQAAVRVFHTAHQADPDRAFKMEDIARPLTDERQYLGAAYLQHSYGGYIYVVGGELYSITAPSSGAYTRVVERMQVADGAGVALAAPGNWETLAALPDDKGGRAIEGWAEFALVSSDAALDADDRLYLVGGRIRVEDAPGSAWLQYEYNDSVLMYEAPLTAAGTGAWTEKPDGSLLTPRRMPMAGLIDGRIYLIGGRAPAGVADYIEMYEPDPSGANPALSSAGAASFPTLSQPVWYGAGALHNGSLYLLNGWKLQGYAPVATATLQKFTPNGMGTGGVLDDLAAPDDASGYHSAVFHDDRLWFVTGRDSYAPTPRYGLTYEP